MNKRVIAIVVVVVIAAVAVYGLTRYKNTSNSSTTSTNQSSNNQPPTTVGSSNAASASGKNSSTPTPTSSVSIQNFAFTPGDITVKKGTAVTWTNSDSTTHTVTEADSQAGPNSGNLSPGSKYTFTFNSTGTFKYKCSIHPEMLGTVTVTD